MNRVKFTFALFFCLTLRATAEKGFGNTEQEWGFIPVKPGGEIFWWLFYTTAPVKTYTERPLIVWLQGGPGASASGYGNFAEIGPLDTDLKPRHHSWVNHVNVLFVDNPVGAGFSTVNSSNVFSTSNREIAKDFLQLLQGFYEAVPEMQNVPLYIFAESYGGKVAAEIGLVIDEAFKEGKLNISLDGLALGDPWISPIDNVLTWAPYLLHLGLIDHSGFESIQRIAERTKKALETKDYYGATNLWEQTEMVIFKLTNNLDFYNVLNKMVYQDPYKTKSEEILSEKNVIDQKIEKLMNNEVKAALGLNVSWGLHFNNVFEALRTDFMKPVTDIIEKLLNNTDIKITIYSGQFDLIVDTPGTVRWIDKLKFIQSNNWRKGIRQPLVVDGIIEGYYKKAGNLAFYWVNRAGHMVPTDNPAAMFHILKDVTNSFQGATSAITRHV